MMLNNQQELSIARAMWALATMFECEGTNKNRIQYQAVIGWHPDQVGERCRYIDANGCDGVVAVFDPAAIERGPAIVGVSIPIGPMVRLELGTLWTGKHGRTALVTAEGYSHLEVEHGRFVEKSGKPTRDLTRGTARARRRLAELAAEGPVLVSTVAAA